MENLAAGHKLLDENAALSDERARDLLRVLDISSIVAFTDVAGNITYVNDKFCEISQYTREELIGKNHRIINSKKHDADFWINFWKTISSGQVWKGEIRNRAKDGSFYWLFTTVIPLLDKFGKPRQYISIRYEITEQKKLELETYLNKAEVEKLKMGHEMGEKFVSMLAHDLRTPLTVAKLSAGLIRKFITIPEKIEIYLNKVVESLERTENMISHLLDANKIRAGEILPTEIKDCDLGKEVSLTLDVLRVIYGERFIYSHVGNLKGEWDQAGLRRITENLCTNAIKYGSAKRPVHVELTGEDHGISLSVCNEGAPLSTADQKNIFDYMHRSATAASSHNKGWGIGLTKVREVAEANGGTVEVSSSTASGTRFIVRMPRKII